MKKNYLALGLGILLSLNLMIVPVNGATVKKPIVVKKTIIVKKPIIKKPVVIPKPTIKKHEPIYNGKEIAKKLSNLGFYYKDGSYFINKYGKNGISQYDYIGFSVWGKSSEIGNVDMNISIMDSTPETDKKLKTILSWILPTKGNTLYAILDNVNAKSQTLELDGRTVSIEIETEFYSINFSPIK